MKHGRPKILSDRSRRAIGEPTMRCARRRLGCDLSGGFAIEQCGVGKLPVARPGAVRADNVAVVDRERFDRGVQPRRGDPQVDRAGFGACVAQRGTRLLHRQAARGRRLVGTHQSRRAHHAHLRERNIELFRRDLRQRGEDTLADLDLAREHFDVAIGVEPEPLRESPIHAQTPGQWRAGNGAARRIERAIHDGSGGLAARSTARTTRL